MAANWKQFERTKHLYPNLEYMPSTAANPRDAHKSLWHTIRPIDDPFWDIYCPPGDWNCKCSIRAVKGNPTNVPDVMPTVSPVFRNNPGKTAEIVNLHESSYYKNTDPILRENVMNFVEKDKVSDKIISEKFAEYNGFSDDYKKHGFDSKSGGYWVSHKDHQFDKKRGHYEKEVAEILYKEGNIVVFESEKYKKFGGKYTEGFLNGIPFDIKSIEGTDDGAIKRAFEGTLRKKAVHSVIYFPIEEIFNAEEFNKGYARFLGLKLGDFEKIWYILDGKIHIYK
jgi:hypothetical protein